MDSSQRALKTKEKLFFFKIVFEILAEKQKILKLIGRCANCKELHRVSRKKGFPNFRGCHSKTIKLTKN